MSAIISAFAAIVVCLINSQGQYKKLVSELNRHDEMHDYRIKKLEEKVDKHNNLIDRTYQLEEARKVYEEKMKVVNHRIDNLEKR